LWTGLIFLTYAGYTQHGFHENLLFVGVEYVLLAGYIFYETLWKRQRVTF